MASRRVGLPQVRGIPVSGYVALRLPLPGAVVTWFVTGSGLRLVDRQWERKSAQDHAFGGLGRHGVWEAHHAERIEQPQAAGENRNEKCYLKG